MKIKEIYPDVITEDTSYEYKAVLNPDNPIKWAKTLIGYANDKGGTLFIGVSNDGEAFGIDLEEVDKTKLLISRINDRHIFPHIKISYMMRSVDSNAEHFVLAVKVAPADSVIRYREGDYNETVFIKGDGNATPATPEEIISLSKRKYGVDNFGPERYHIITAKHGFHGRTYGAMSATGQPDNAIQMGFKPMLPGFDYAEYNNLEDFKSKVTENTIAIMIEPVQGEGGVHPATQEFIEGLRKLCDEKDMLLLFDEVQTGWGRTGAPMAYMGYGVKPDAVSMAKAVGGGMPLAACCATEKVAKAFTAGTHGSTYGGHCVTCAAGLASVTEILDNNLSENAKEMGEYMKQELAKLPHVKEARGRGLLVGCEYDIPIAVEVKHGCLDRMALITAIGDSVNRMIPPLIVTKKQIDELMLIMRASIEDAAAKYESK